MDSNLTAPSATGPGSASSSSPAATTDTTSSRPARISSPWANPKLITGAGIVAGILVLTAIGHAVVDTSLARAASSPLNLPPFWMEGGTLAHPLGTENSGRDMLALLVVGSPMTLQIGLVVGLTSMVLGIVFGFAAGYLGGVVDTVIRTLSDTALTIPSLAILVVIAAYVREMNVNTMAFIVALFAWAGPTRLIRAQVLSMREQGYIKMAKLSALSTPHIMFREMLPNLLPYVAAGFIGATSGGILAAVGLEALGLGPQRIPTLGMTVSRAIEGSAILRGMWWWWGLPTLILMLIFAGLFLIAIGLDEVANPRLRQARPARGKAAA
ncbi:MAG TPA: ABC transporter permease [Actinopolymorphaceae bacterium]